GGYELDRLDVFNLFAVNATGTFVFDSIDDLEAGHASSINGAGSYTGDINDAAASFKRNVNTIYLQDVWTISDRMVLTAGLRYDWYTSNDSPVENPIWMQRYGFENTTSFDGLDILQPRIGLTYDLPWNKMGEMQLRAGFGIFSGGDPTVHFANSFQNFGGAIGNGRSSRAPCTEADLDVLSSGSFQGVPPCIINQQIAEANLNLGRATAVDPDFDLPQQNRFNIGFSLFTESTTSFFDGWDVNFDIIYSKAKNAANWLDLTLTQRVDEDGNLVWLPDGRPQFFAVDPLLPGCDAVFIGPGKGFSNVTADCNSGRDDQDILMTNGRNGSTTSVSLQGSKHWDIGQKSSFDLRLGYAYTNAKVGNPVNSSTDTSSFEEVAVAVINDVKIGPAVWANKHNIVLGATFKHFFWDDNATSIGIFFRTYSGNPFSYTYDNNTSTGVFGDSDNEERILFYVPTGEGDPLVDFSVLDAQGTTQDFFDWMDRKGLSKYAGEISPKNGFDEPWNTDLDLRISQEIPLPRYNHRLVFFFDIENLLNLFSDSSNLQKYYSKGDVQEGLPVLDAALSDDGSQFIYSNFNPGGGNSSGTNYNPVFYDVDDSVWRMQIGLRYEFN
ncbi:MAG: TonB-dependent receptor, partial [Xanthomonadales bacterium]|nr:TonB-dependent receptor [Xanthomonadales bacterium]